MKEKEREHTCACGCFVFACCMRDKGRERERAFACGCFVCVCVCVCTCVFMDVYAFSLVFVRGGVNSMQRTVAASCIMYSSWTCQINLSLFITREEYKAKQNKKKNNFPVK